MDCSSTPALIVASIASRERLSMMIGRRGWPTSLGSKKSLRIQRLLSGSQQMSADMGNYLADDDGDLTGTP